MHLLALLRRESAIALRKFVLMSAVAGLSNAAILSIINTAIEEATGVRQHRISEAIYFAVTMFIFYYARNYVLNVSVSEMERVLDRVRIRLAHDVVQAELQDIETLGPTDIFTALNTNTPGNFGIRKADPGRNTGSRSALLYPLLYRVALVSGFRPAPGNRRGCGFGLLLPAAGAGARSGNSHHPGIPFQPMSPADAGRV